jgi:pimeloyl-ACP methyl ester carboxylesterase
VPPLRDDAVRLPDGRRLAFVEWGDVHGDPVLFFHGMPHSRLWCPDEAVTAAEHVHLVTVDRPGVGGSDVLPRRTFASWVADVVELADALRIDRFGVVGWSAGGPYAAACAALIPDRLTGAAIASSHALCQYNYAENPAALEELDAEDREVYELAQRNPDAAARIAGERSREFTEMLQARPEALGDNYQIPDGDRWFHEDPELARVFYEAVREGIRQGWEALRWNEIDAEMPWGFRLADIAMKVHIFYGAQDTIVEQRHIDFTLQTLPNPRLTVWDDSGHAGIARHWDQVLHAVTAQ